MRIGSVLSGDKAGKRFPTALFSPVSVVNGKATAQPLLYAVPVPHRPHLGWLTPAEGNPLLTPAVAPLGGNIFVLIADWNNEV